MIFVLLMRLSRDSRETREKISIWNSVFWCFFLKACIKVKFFMIKTHFAVSSSFENSPNRRFLLFRKKFCNFYMKKINIFLTIYMKKALNKIFGLRVDRVSLKVDNFGSNGEKKFFCPSTDFYSLQHFKRFE